jgi:hypothetical protein
MTRKIFTAAAALIVLAPSLAAQGVPTPVEHFGFELGSDRQLADWDQLTSYYEKLAESSQRVTLDTLGATTMGRPFVMLTVTSAENQARIEELHEIQMKLADPRTISSESELERLLDQGRTVVLITHQIHSTEVGGGQTAARMLHKLASSDDPAIRRILDNVILLDIPALNPDGLQWVSEWYMDKVGTQYEGESIPWLYHFYTGHDNNRDWYAFTQLETQLTITGAHNAWHPQIVHDIHQMGGNGARIFFPPYIEPWEPNIDPALTSAVGQLGSYMQAELTAQGKAGVVTGAQYDAYTPARAYQHYHAGARILSETASARLASPVDVDPARFGPRRGYDASQRSANFPMPWEGGEWGLPDIVDYMEAGAMALLTNAAANRRFWLENFYGVNRRAVDGWDEWPEAWVIPAGQTNQVGVSYVLRILTMGDVEVHQAERAFTADGISFPAGSYVIPMQQPYASFANTMLEVQYYPDLRTYPGGPPARPYDVTAHTLPYLMDVEAVALDENTNVPLSDPLAVPDWNFELPDHLTGDQASRVGVLKTWQEPMEGGWTRWVFDQHGLAYDTLSDADVRAGGLADSYDVILIQSQDGESLIDGYEAGRLPPQYTGGLGAQGTGALSDFVHAGGRLVVIEEAADFAIDLFGLRLTNPVDGLSGQDFYIPGSILRLELESGSGITEGLDPESVAWYWRSSRAFEVGDSNVKVIARYGSGDPLLSGWVLGGDRVAGQPAIVQASVGQGSVVLFGFQPNYRAQSVATWPLLFNALSR